MGETSDRVKTRAKDMAQDGVEEAAAAAGRTFDAVKDEAKAQGLTPEDAVDAAGSISDRVKKVAGKGRAKLKEEIGAAESPTPREGI